MTNRRTSISMQYVWPFVVYIQELMEISLSKLLDFIKFEERVAPYVAYQRESGLFLCTCVCVSKRSTLGPRLFWKKNTIFVCQRRNWRTALLYDTIVILRIQFIYWTTTVADMVIGHFTDKLYGGKNALALLPLQSPNNIMPTQKKVSAAFWHSSVARKPDG